MGNRERDAHRLVIVERARRRSPEEFVSGAGPAGPSSIPTPQKADRRYRDLMQPFERLRYIARHGADDRTLVVEAADCLADFDGDPAGLVVTCRRLLHHHPDCGPLWWLCARVLVAPAPS